jgi:ferredoxin
MPKLTVEGFGTFDIEQGKRLVLAIEQDAQVDILHACGGNARCTTCRVEFIEGEPDRMTVAEQQVLAAKGATGAHRQRTPGSGQHPRHRDHPAA